MPQQNSSQIDTECVWAQLYAGGLLGSCSLKYECVVLARTGVPGKVLSNALCVCVCAVFYYYESLDVNPLKYSGVSRLHLEVFSAMTAIQV